MPVPALIHWSALVAYQNTALNTYAKSSVQLLVDRLRWLRWLRWVLRDLKLEWRNKVAIDK